MDWKKESEMFDRMADYYDRYRPGYPPEIIDTVIGDAQLAPGSNLLEIGAGSGKATGYFAKRGYQIQCVDPGETLVQKGRKKFKNDPDIRFAVSRFEDYHVSENTYDLIFSAQSFHWVPQPEGYIKCAAALKNGGTLALFWNMYITYDNETDRALVALSDQYGGFADFLSEEQCEQRIAAVSSGIEESGLFSKPKVTRCIWKQTYTADDYFGFAQTGNSFVQKSEEDKAEAYREIKALFDKNGGKIERPYLCVLYTAQKL